jgi:TPR repeat protein
MTDFETEYREVFDRALALGLKARSEGLLGLEDELDEEKEKVRDIFEWGLRLAVDGTSSVVIDKILTNLINQETDKDKITMGEIKKDAILAIQAGWPHYLIALLINSHVNIDVEETLKKFGMDGEDRYKMPSLEEIVCRKCGQTNFLFPDTAKECDYCGNELFNPEEEVILSEQDIRFNNAMELYNAKQYVQAKPLIEELANEGYAPAQTKLGNYYYWGGKNGEDWGVEQDLDKANEWYFKAAQQDDPDGLNNLGASYLSGEGVEKDEAKALELYLKAAGLGSAQAQYNLGINYYFGDILEKDLDKACFWCRRAAYQGHTTAQEMFGTLFYFGEVVTQDYEQAIEWFSKAAEKDSEFSMYYLGECYLNGNGVRQDLAKAYDYYQKAANLGNPYAQDAVGVCLMFGFGVKQDYAKAFEYFQKAASPDNAGGEVNEAKLYLGICYYFGIGVKEDRVQAKSILEQMADDYEDAAELLKGTPLIPLSVTNVIKGFCQDNGWYVYQRISMEGQLFPLVLVGNKKIIIACDKQDIMPLVQAKNAIKRFLAMLVKSVDYNEIEVIPVVLTIKEMPIDVTKISGECKERNVKNFDVDTFKDFIEKLGNQGEIEQSLFDEMTQSIVGVVETEDN